MLHITADNVDIQLDTLDGKRSFHGTQMVEFQRACSSLDNALGSAVRSKEKSLLIPKAVGTLIPPAVAIGKVEPPDTTFNLQWYSPEEQPVGAQQAWALDTAFLVYREQSSEVKNIYHLYVPIL